MSSLLGAFDLLKKRDLSKSFWKKNKETARSDTLLLQMKYSFTFLDP